jgi:DNA primase
MGAENGIGRDVSDYDRIKERLDIQAFIEQTTGFSMKGKHLSECPFCGGHGCFSIDREKGLYKCFQCPAEGDVFTFLENYHNIDKAEALRKAAAFAGISLAEYPAKKPRDFKLTTKERIFIESAAYYHANALKNGGKEYYLAARGHKEESVAAMQCGWSDGGLIDHLTNKGFTDLEIKASGLAREVSLGDSRKLLDFFGNGFAVFPHWEGGRVLHFTMKDPKKKHTYQLEAVARSKEWRFYNQGALSRFNEIIIVEGENDLLSVLDAGVNHVIGLIGQPSEEQIKALRSFCAKKHIYLWLDNDEDPDKPLLKGKGFIRKICAELSGEQHIRIITYPEEIKDPDDYLRGFKGDAKREVKRLQQDSLDYIDWEITEISKLNGLDKRLQALKERKVFAALAEMLEVERLVKSEKLEALGFTSKAIQEQIEINHELSRALELYFYGLQNKREADPNHVATLIFKNLSKQGRFFRDSEHKTYLFYQHFIYEIASNRPFNALMKRTTRLLPTKEPGRSVWESLASEAYNVGMKIDLASWIHTDRNTDTLFINLNGPNNTILKVSTESIEEIQNGLNEDAVLLQSSRKIMPLNFLPDADIREGMRALKENIFDNLPCERENKYLVLCWLMSAFLLDFAPYMALMKFSGSTASGKTTAAKLLSLLLYGNEHLGDPSTAAMYAVSSQNPLLIVDNLESDDITKSGLKFLLLSATKGGKEKRTAGTESGTTEEMPKALVLITAIEPFTKAELINRTYDIEYNNKFKSDDFVEDEVIRQIIKKRDLILSALIKLIQKDILPNLSRRKDYITILKKEYRNHAKNRTDEFMALLMLILEKVEKYIPYYEVDDVCFGVESGDAEIRKAWIEYQDSKAKDSETSTNSILKMLDGLVAEYLLKMKTLEKLETTWHKDYEEDVFNYQHPEYGLEIIKSKPAICTDEGGQEYMRTYVEFIATPRDLVFAFDRFCRNNGIKNPYSTAGIFGERLKNDRHLLTKGSWEIISKEGMEPYWKVIRGERFWKFRKTIMR